jgi:hypothetical protein
LEKNYEEAMQLDSFKAMTIRKKIEIKQQSEQSLIDFLAEYEAEQQSQQSQKMLKEEVKGDDDTA